jgi:dTMP kinase
VGVTRTAIRATQGKFITVEGIEGVGKSTNMNRLTAAIQAGGHRVLRTREPGGTRTAEEIRNIVLGHSDEVMPPMAELLLMFAARALHAENVIRPALAAGTWVVSDRFVDASRAYQSGGRGVPMSRVDELANWVVGDLVPDLTILLDAPVGIALARTRARGAQDRLDAETAEFYERVRSTYLALAAAEPRRFVIVDAGAELPAVAAAIDRIARQLTGPSP